MHVQKGWQQAGAVLMGESSAMFEFIAEMEAKGTQLTVREMCALSGVSRSGYYAWKAAAPEREKREELDRADFELILKAYNRKGYAKGVRAIHMVLLHQDPPVLMNQKKIRRLMRKFNLICPVRKPNPHRRIAQALKESSTAPNVLQREFESYGPRTVLLTDITYLPYDEGRQTAYLSPVFDGFTKEVLAWTCSESLEMPLVLDMIERLEAEHGSELGDAVLVHSDQGSHYTSCAFRKALTDRNFIQSMSRRGNCWDNQPMEYFFSGLKDHIRRLVLKCRTIGEVAEQVDRYMDYYNNDRYQWKLAKLSPAEFYKFCTTGIYPLAIDPVPDPPIPAGDPQTLRQRADEMAAARASCAAKQKR